MGQSNANICNLHNRSGSQYDDKIKTREFPGGLVVRIWCVHCHGLTPGLGTKNLTNHTNVAKKKNPKKIKTPEDGFTSGFSICSSKEVKCHETQGFHFQGCQENEGFSFIFVREKNMRIK